MAKERNLNKRVRTGITKIKNVFDDDFRAQAEIKLV